MAARCLGADIAGPSVRTGPIGGRRACAELSVPRASVGRRSQVRIDRRGSSMYAELFCTVRSARKVRLDRDAAVRRRPRRATAPTGPAPICGTALFVDPLIALAGPVAARPRRLTVAADALADAMTPIRHDRSNPAQPLRQVSDVDATRQRRPAAGVRTRPLDDRPTSRPVPAGGRQPHRHRGPPRGARRAAAPAAAARAVELRDLRRRSRPGRRRAGHRPAGPAARPGRCRGVGRRAAPGRLRLGRARRRRWASTRCCPRSAGAG